MKGRNSRSTRSSARSFSSSTASSRSSSRTSTSVPPEHQVPNSSWNDTSNDSGENCNVRVPGPAMDCPSCHAIRLASGPWPIATPLGVPVEPEV
ncbi:hypothetical protein COSO111634_22070 [Corallococcus soli]